MVFSLYVYKQQKPLKAMSKQLTTLRTKAKRKNAKKELSIQEISPAWAGILPIMPKTERQEFYKSGKKLDISDCKYCVVGEAYGFSDSYSHNENDDYCYPCFACAVNFGFALILNPEEREGLVNTFVDHWNDSHV